MNKKLILYGVLLAVLVLVLKLAEYKLLIIDHSIELYGGVIALMFTTLGVIAGRKLNTPKEVLVEVPVQVAANLNFVRDEKMLDKTGLSKREYEILELIAAGLSNEEIAAKMYLSVHTIKTHISSLFLKLDVKRRTQAVVKAREIRLIP